MNEISICFLFFCFVFILLCKLSVLLKLEVTRILLCKSNYFLCSKCWECFDDFDFCLLLSTRSSIAINCKIYLYIYTTTPYESVHHFISDTDCLQSMFVGRCRRWRVANDLSMRWDSPLELMNRGQSHFWMMRKKNSRKCESNIVKCGENDWTYDFDTRLNACGCMLFTWLLLSHIKRAILAFFNSINWPMWIE